MKILPLARTIASTQQTGWAFLNGAGTVLKVGLEFVIRNMREEKITVNKKFEFNHFKILLLSIRQIHSNRCSLCITTADMLIVCSYTYQYSAIDLFRENSNKQIFHMPFYSCSTDWCQLKVHNSIFSEDISQWQMIDSYEIYKNVSNRMYSWFVSMYIDKLNEKNSTKVPWAMISRRSFSQSYVFFSQAIRWDILISNHS